MEKLSFVVPVYNSQQTLEELVGRIEKTVQNLKTPFLYEIILVNDYSLDNSLEICKKICREKQEVKLINLAKNFGQHHAIMAGIHYITGDYLVCLDDDLQTPPEEIQGLLGLMEQENFDVVYARYRHKNHSLTRNLGSFLNNFMAHCLINKPPQITVTSFFIARRFVAEEIIKYDNPYPYLPGLILRVTQNIGSAYTAHHERKAGKSNYNFKKLLSLWVNGFTNFSVRPLRISSLMGFGFSLLSFFWIIYLVILKLRVPETQLGWTSLMVIISFFGGIQLMTIGLLGEYVGRIYLSINKMPQYVVKDTLNISDKSR